MIRLTLNKLINYKHTLIKSISATKRLNISYLLLLLFLISDELISDENFRRIQGLPLEEFTQAFEDLYYAGLNARPIVEETFFKHSQELLTTYLPEWALTSMVVYLFVIIAFELGEGRPKKILAIETWRALQTGLVLIGLMYLAQLILGLPSAVTMNGYFFSANGIVASKLLVLAASTFVLNCSEQYIREHRRHVLEYALILTTATLMLLILVGSNNLMSMFFSIVGFSLCLYVLIFFDVDQLPSREAALKYFYLSTLSSGLILIGIFLIYAATGYAEFGALKMFFLLSPTGFNSTVVGTAIICIMIGFFFKLSAFPGHLWAVEVYEGSPTPIMAFFILPVKIAVLIVFVRLLNTAFAGLSLYWLPPLMIAAIGSLVWGAFAAAHEKKIKRFLGYASINQIGFLLLSVATDTTAGLVAMYFYLILYVLMSVGFLLVFMTTRRADRFNLVYLSDFRGLAKTEWLSSWSLAIFLFSMAGIPPLAGFFGKLLVLVAVLEKGLYGPAVIAIAVSLISAYYYLRVIKIFWFEEDAGLTPIYHQMGRGQRVLLTIIEATLWLSPLLLASALPLLAQTTQALTVSGFIAMGFLFFTRNTQSTSTTQPVEADRNTNNIEKVVQHTSTENYKSSDERADDAYPATNGFFPVLLLQRAWDLLRKQPLNCQHPLNPALLLSWFVFYPLMIVLSFIWAGYEPALDTLITHYADLLHDYVTIIIEHKSPTDWINNPWRNWINGSENTDPFTPYAALTPFAAKLTPPPVPPTAGVPTASKPTPAYALECVRKPLDERNAKLRSLLKLALLYWWFVFYPLMIIISFLWAGYEPSLDVTITHYSDLLHDPATDLNVDYKPAVEIVDDFSLPPNPFTFLLRAVREFARWLRDIFSLPKVYAAGRDDSEPKRPTPRASSWNPKNWFTRPINWLRQVYQRLTQKQEPLYRPSSKQIRKTWQQNRAAWVDGTEMHEDPIPPGTDSISSLHPREFQDGTNLSRYNPEAHMSPWSAHASSPIKYTLEEIDKPWALGRKVFNNLYEQKSHGWLRTLKAINAAPEDGNADVTIMLAVNATYPALREERERLVETILDHYSKPGFTPEERAYALRYVNCMYTDSYLNIARYGAMITASRHYFPGRPLMPFVQWVAANPLPEKRWKD